MGLCVRDEKDIRSKYNVLHETGHALGLFHEHQHPDAVDIYDREAVIKDLKGVSRSEAERYYETNFEKSEKRDEDDDEDEDEKKYDPNSVMRYE